jgi:molybdopterin-guanine dinucleotide biosynthesis protein A
MPDTPRKIPAFPCVILAGGLSRRMGTNKSLVRLGGRTLLEHIVERLSPQAGAMALNGDRDWHEPSGLRRVPDTFSEKLGPLAGILAAMRDTASHHPAATHVLTVPTDAPLLPADLMARLAAAVTSTRSIAVASSDGNLHPVVGLWPLALADNLEAWIVTDEKRRVRHFLQRHQAIEVDFPVVETPVGRFDPFLNLNTPEELAAAEKWLEGWDQ